jgi:hypothetical protein
LIAITVCGASGTGRPALPLIRPVVAVFDGPAQVEVFDVQGGRLGAAYSGQQDADDRVVADVLERLAGGDLVEVVEEVVGQDRRRLVLAG